MLVVLIAVKIVQGARLSISTFGLSFVWHVAWDPVHDIPTALVTGSNGKTTTVRLLAACSRAHGWQVTYSSTDGVFFDGEAVATGDYSGPAGGRMAVRDRRAQAAILETARGGILRRGIAVSRAQVALVTNVSSDHFGEYGIFDLDGLADVMDRAQEGGLGRVQDRPVPWSSVGTILGWG